MNYTSLCPSNKGSCMYMLECMTHKLFGSVHRDRTTSTETSPLPVYTGDGYLKDILLHHAQKHTHTD